MKIKRYKRARKILNFYKHCFSVTPPYRIVTDGTFLKAALDNKINLREQMPIYLCSSECRFFVTRCILKELECLGPTCRGALAIARDYKLAKCKHNKTALTGSQCLQKLATKMKDVKYFFATQDRTLTENLRNVPGCPILFIKYNCILLEKPTEMSEKATEDETQTKLNFEGVQKDNLTALLKSNDLLNTGSDEVPKKRRRKIKGPNPLSCKKKKVDKTGIRQPDQDGNKNLKKRSRKRRKRTDQASASMKAD